MPKTSLVKLEQSGVGTTQTDWGNNVPLQMQWPTPDIPLPQPLQGPHPRRVATMGTRSCCTATTTLPSRTPTTDSADIGGKLRHLSGIDICGARRCCGGDGALTPQKTLEEETGHYERKGSTSFWTPLMEQEATHIAQWLERRQPTPPWRKKPLSSKCAFAGSTPA